MPPAYSEAESGLLVPSYVSDAGAVQSTRRSSRLVNTRSGQGGATDKDYPTRFVPIRLNRAQAEGLYQASWAAQRMVDIKIDDMFVRGRVHTDGDDTTRKAILDAENSLEAMPRLADALKQARIFGSSLLIVCTDDGNFDQPLTPETLRPGSITNLWVVDRWSCSIESWVTDPSVPGFGRPYRYRVNSRIVGAPSPDMTPDVPGLCTPNRPDVEQLPSQFVVHRDRVFRFDGLRSGLTEGWVTGAWHRDWGISILAKAIDDIVRDAATAAGIGHLVQEASVWVQKIHGFKDSVKGRTPDNEPTAEEIAEEVTLLKSIFHTLFIDAEDEAERVNVQFAGLVDIFEHQENRLASVEGVPITRFRGTSATGLNATGKGDARDWRITVAALQKSMLDPVLRRFDELIAAHAGVAEPLPYEWVPLGEQTEQEQAELRKTNAETIVAVYNAGFVTEDESRRQLEKDEWWGELGPYVDAIPGEPPDPDPPAPIAQPVLPPPDEPPLTDPPAAPAADPDDPDGD